MTLEKISEMATILFEFDQKYGFEDRELTQLADYEYKRLYSEASQWLLEPVEDFPIELTEICYEHGFTI
jgi:hypothetical protein